MFFWGIVIQLLFSSGPGPKPIKKTRGRSGRKKFFFAEHLCLCCFIGISRGFEKNLLFWENIDFSGEASTGNGDFRVFPRLSVPTNGGRMIVPRKRNKNGHKSKKNKAKPKKTRKNMNFGRAVRDLRGGVPNYYITFWC